MKRLKLSLKNRAILSLIVLIASSLWDAVFAFTNMHTENVLNQTINFCAGAIIFILFAKLIRYILKGSNLELITYVISCYYIAHGILYIYNFIVYWDDWEGWVNRFYDYQILIPAMMVLIIFISILRDIISWNIKRWMKKM